MFVVKGITDKQKATAVHILYIYIYIYKYILNIHILNENLVQYF